MDPSKISGVKDWLILKSMTKVKSSSTLTSFYPWFAWESFKIVEPLTKLMRKAKKYDWTKNVLHLLKKNQRLTTILVLAIPDENKAMVVYNNTHGED